MSAAQIDPVKLERKRALQRAGLAAVAALVLLIGVLIAEDGREPESVVAPPPELPVRAAEVTPPAPTAPAEDSATVRADAATAGPDPVAAQTAVTSDEHSAAAKVSEAPAPVIPAAPAAAAPVAAATPANTTPANTAAASTAPAAPLPDGYLVQLGVFGAMENAEALRANIAALGLPVRIEGRVVVGPFRDKAAADAAQGKLRREGVAVGFVVPPRAAGARPGK